MLALNDAFLNFLLAPPQLQHWLATFEAVTFVHAGVQLPLLVVLLFGLLLAVLLLLRALPGLLLLGFLAQRARVLAELLGRGRAALRRGRKALGDDAERWAARHPEIGWRRSGYPK